MINRRTFLTLAGSAASGLCLPNPMMSTAPKRLTKIGVQLYTVRRELEKNFEGTLERVAATGFKEVEFAGYFGRTPEQVKAALDRHGLLAPSAHTMVAGLTNNFEKTIEAARRIGHAYLICAYLLPNERKSLDDYKRLAALFNRAGEQCRQAGIQFGYHNHDFEFMRMDGQLPFDVLLAETDAKLVRIELDLYWITKGKQDPLAYFDKHPGRFEIFHVKDMDNTPKQFFTEVGRGIVDFKTIFAQGKKSGVKHYFVEQDECPASPFDSIKVSYEYLKQLEF